MYMYVDVIHNCSNHSNGTEDGLVAGDALEHQLAIHLRK